MCKICGNGTIKVNKHGICLYCKNKEKGLKCDICGTTEKIRMSTRDNQYGMILCGKHLAQLVRGGKIVEINKFSPNEYVLYPEEGYAEIIIRNHPKSGEEAVEIARAIIDIEDVEKCKQYKWHSSKGYPLHQFTNYKQKSIYLHALVTDCPEDLYVNHRNFNPMDARKNNLQICTHAQNSKYKGLYSSNTSGIRGLQIKSKITLETRYKRKNKYFGSFTDLREAVFIMLAVEIANCREFTNLHYIIKACQDNNIEFIEILNLLNDKGYDLSFLSNKYVINDLLQYGIDITKYEPKPCNFKVLTCTCDVINMEFVTK